MPEPRKPKWWEDKPIQSTQQIDTSKISLFTSKVNHYFALCFSDTSWSGRKSLEDVLVSTNLKQITAVLK